jgi:hypothetical protein
MHQHAACIGILRFPSCSVTKQQAVIKWESRCLCKTLSNYAEESIECQQLFYHPFCTLKDSNDKGDGNSDCNQLMQSEEQTFGHALGKIDAG